MRLNPRNRSECLMMLCERMGWRAWPARAPASVIVGLNRPALFTACAASSLPELQAHARRVERWRWPHEVVVIGTRFLESDIGPCLGLLREGTAQKETSVWPRSTPERDASNLWLGSAAKGSWAGAFLFTCAHCRRPSFGHELMSYRCRASGCNPHAGDDHIGRSPVTDGAGAYWQSIVGRLSKRKATRRCRGATDGGFVLTNIYDLPLGRGER